MIILLFCVFSLCLSADVYATYLDPGVGSYIFQILIAGIVAGLFAVKLFWGQIKSFFKKLFGKEKSDKENDS